MGRRGDAYDNAVAESFFATLETELLMRTSFATRNQARSEVFDYIEGFYNPHRRHSAIGYHSPTDYERTTKPTQLPSKPESRKLSTKAGQLQMGEAGCFFEVADGEFAGGVVAVGAVGFDGGLFSLSVGVGARVAVVLPGPGLVMLVGFDGG